MRKRSLSLFILGVLFSLCVIVPQAVAQPFVLTKVVDTNTPIPGGTGNFNFFAYGYPPPYMVSGVNVAFQAGSEWGKQYGIYLFEGTTLTTVADYNTPIPGGSGNFTYFLSGNPVISGSNAAFHGEGGPQDGIYLFDGTTLRVVADTNTPVPSGSGNFWGFDNYYNPVISDNNIAIRGYGIGQDGVYLFNGNTLSKVADNNTPIPEGSGNFDSFSSVAISGSNVAFAGSGTEQCGIYLFNGSALVKVVNNNTPIPQGMGNFNSFSAPLISGDNIAFQAGNNSGQYGIYLFNGTTLNKVVDYNTPIPGGSRNFTFFSYPVISGNIVAFQGSEYGGQDGIYLFDGIALSKVADTNTPIPDASGNFTFFSTPVISNGNVAFFGRGTVEGGIYLFNGTTVSKVADTNTPIPGGSGNFTGFSEPVINDGKVVFGAGGAGLQGFYLATNGSEWTISTIDSEGDVGPDTSIAIDSNNKAHISYVDNENADLKYATNASGSWEAITLSSDGDVGIYCSIAVDLNNKVHISYYDSTRGTLNYSNNVSGSWEMVPIDHSGSGWYTSICVDSSNRIHISYFDFINTDLKYATNASGSWQTFTIDSTGTVGKYTSIGVDSNDNVHIAYLDNTNSCLKYATNASGSWITSIVDGSMGFGISMAIDSNNKVHISYPASTSSALKYATNASGSWVTSTIDSGGLVGDYSSIAIDSYDKIHISYFDNTNADLKYATNVSGSWVTSALDGAGIVGGFTSIAIDSNDKVHISYYDGTNGDLKYATNATVCSLPIITTQPQSQTIQSGRTASMSVSASGTTPFTYQWHQGSSGDTSTPISGATSSSYTTPALSNTTNYWVRVTNSCGSADSNTATVTVALAGISVVSPNGGETLPVGSLQKIRWSYFGNPGAYVKIELLKGGVVNRMIKSLVLKGTGGSGSCNWTIPANLAPGTGYRIRVTGTKNSTYTDTSDSDFTIAAPTITVVSPNGGESLTAGTTQTIRWSYTGNPGAYVKIELLKGGVVDRTIASPGKGVGGSGSRNWTIPSNQAPGIDYTIRVTSTSNGAYTDTSDNDFTIQ